MQVDGNAWYSMQSAEMRSSHMSVPQHKGNILLPPTAGVGRNNFDAAQPVLHLLGDSRAGENRHVGDLAPWGSHGQHMHGVRRFNLFTSKPLASLSFKSDSHLVQQDRERSLGKTFNHAVPGCVYASVHAAWLRTSDI